MSPTERALKEAHERIDALEAANTSLHDLAWERQQTIEDMAGTIGSLTAELWVLNPRSELVAELNAASGLVASEMAVAA